MSPVQFAVLLTAGAFAFWRLGGVVCRVGGVVCLVAGAAGLAIERGVEAPGLLGLGSVMWLVGQWHYAFRHGGYRSPVAALLFCRWGPAWLDPTRHRVVVAISDDLDHV
jgi:hypothetical protein